MKTLLAINKSRVAPLLILAVQISFSAAPASAQSFEHVPVAGLSNVDNSSIAWADFDNDGRLDFILLGTTGAGVAGPRTQLWRNTGSTFTNVPVPDLPSLHIGSVAWGDYDRDGRLDFVISGQATNMTVTRVTQLWRNTPSGFSNVTSAVAPELPQVNQSCVAWGDLNGDGRLDLYVSGFSATGNVASVWINNGNVFTNATSSIATGLQGMSSGSAALADFDNDQRVDLLLTGDTGPGGPISQLWRNTSSGLVNVTATHTAGLPAVYLGSTSWGDFDGDGLIDFLITGESSTGRITQIWHNQGGSFINFPVSGLSPARYASAAWGDFNSDGSLDFILAGDFLGNGTNQLWLNTGTTFTNRDVGFPAIWMLPKGATATADYDNDGRLDVLLSGTVPGDGRLTQLWRNTFSPANTPPPAPTAATAMVSNNVVTLSWAAPVDAESGTNLTYNLRIGTSPGGEDILTPSAASNGFRRIPALGNVNHRRTASFKLSPGVYYWSVQAVDGTFSGGAFAPEQSFEIFPETPPALSIARAGTNVTISWTPAAQGWVLQETANLTSNTWSNSPTGSTNPVSLPANQIRFFRLHRP